MVKCVLDVQCACFITKPLLWGKKVWGWGEGGGGLTGEEYIVKLIGVDTVIRWMILQSGRREGITQHKKYT